MYKLLYGFIITLSALLCNTALIAQDTALLNGVGVEANLIAGKIIKHTVNFHAPVPAVSSAAEINFVWQTYGRKKWEQRRKFPQVGVGIIYTDYGLNSVFGRCVGVDANLQLPIIKGKKMGWYCRLGLGLAYVTKCYSDSPPYDTINNAVSTHLNAFPVFESNVRYSLDKHWDVQAGVSFTHISNALFSEPNLGVNMVGGHIGMRYFPLTSHPKCLMCELPRLRNRVLLEARAAISYKHARAEGSPVMPAYIGAVAVSRRWLGKNKLFAGVDYAYHKDVYAFLKNYGVDRGVEKQNSWDGSFFAGNEFIVGRVGMMLQVGTYYHQTFLHFDSFVEKIGIKYYLMSREHGPMKETFLSAILTTHGIVAEYSEFGIGFCF